MFSSLAIQLGDVTVNHAHSLKCKRGVESIYRYNVFLSKTKQVYGFFFFGARRNMPSMDTRDGLDLPASRSEFLPIRLLQQVLFLATYISITTHGVSVMFFMLSERQIDKFSLQEKKKTHPTRSKHLKTFSSRIAPTFVLAKSIKALPDIVIRVE